MALLEFEIQSSESAQRDILINTDYIVSIHPDKHGKAFITLSCDTVYVSTIDYIHVAAELKR